MNSSKLSPLVVAASTMILAVVGAVLAVAYAASKPPSYSAQSRVLVSVSPNAADWVASAQASQIQTFSEMVSTDYVLGPVAQAMGTGTRADSLPGTVSGHVALSTSLIDISATAGSADDAKALANNTQASLIKAIAKVGPRSGKGVPMMEGISLSQATTAQAKGSSKPVAAAMGLLVGACAGLAFGRALRSWMRRKPGASDSAGRDGAANVEA